MKSLLLGTWIRTNLFKGCNRNEALQGLWWAEGGSQFSSHRSIRFHSAHQEEAALPPEIHSASLSRSACARVVTVASKAFPHILPVETLLLSHLTLRVYAQAGLSPTWVVVTCLCVFLSHHTLSLWKVGLFFYVALHLVHLVGFSTYLLMWMGLIYSWRRGLHKQRPRFTVLNFSIGPCLAVLQRILFLFSLLYPFQCSTWQLSLVTNGPLRELKKLPKGSPT